METISAPATIYHRAARIARRGSNKKGQTQDLAGRPARYGFLDHAFQPIVLPNWEFINDMERVEAGFFQSLQHLSLSFGMELPDYRDTAYPYNIYLAYNAAKRKLEEINPSIKLQIIEKDDDSFTLVTLQVFDPGPHLFFIPVRPLKQLLNNKQTEDLGKLTLSVYAWLHQCCHVDYYTRPDTYLNGVIDGIDNWLMDTKEEYTSEEYQENKTELRSAIKDGKSLYKRLNRPYHIDQWEKRLQKFQPKGEGEKLLLDACQSAWQLYKNYPGRSPFDNLNPELIGEMDYDYIVSADQYLSFSWELEGWLSEQIDQWVNADFDSAYVDYPRIFRMFDQPRETYKDPMEFEHKFFNLLQDLIYAIHHIQ